MGSNKNFVSKAFSVRYPAINLEPYILLFLDMKQILCIVERKQSIKKSSGRKAIIAKILNGQMNYSTFLGYISKCLITVLLEYI